MTRDSEPGRQPAADEHLLVCASSGARVIVGEYPARSEFDTHEHAEAYLCLALRGGYDEWAAGRRRQRVRVGAPLLYREGSRHAVRTGEESLRLVHVTDPKGTDWAEGASSLARGILWQLGAAARRDRASDDATALHVDSLVAELGARTDPIGSDDWLGAVLDRLREDYADPISLSELAAAVERHPAHVARAFRARWRMTAGEFLRRVRVAAAIRQLSESDEPLAIVALDCGFSDQSHMGRWMRAYVGMTPREVRRTGRGGD